MATPNKVHIANGVPTITLAREKFPVPLLRLRDIEKVLEHSANITQDSLLTPNVDLFKALSNIAYVALTRVHDVTMEEFRDMEITFNELLEAFPIILQQMAGGVQPVAAGESQGANAPTTAK